MEGKILIKVIMIFDQIQSGFGTKDDKMIPLKGTKELLGPSVTLSPMLKEIDAKIVACFYCGNGFYDEDPTEIRRKICAKLEQLKPDVVICGPSFNYEDYSKMCVEISSDINNKTSVKSFVAMSKENEELISKYANELLIVETPKKGGVGLNDSFKNIVSVVKEIHSGKDFNKIREKFCFKV